ncbi:SPFH domain-containing protein [Streptomyces sp. NPDC002057]|uniref:SPFH domain-containing protein n=1 Tax=Streptomyces sp. NPDC002057 TaxID=3154664 RepID=UPI003316B0BD
MASVRPAGPSGVAPGGADSRPTGSAAAAGPETADRAPSAARPHQATGPAAGTAPVHRAGAAPSAAAVSSATAGPPAAVTPGSRPVSGPGAGSGLAGTRAVLSTGLSGATAGGGPGPVPAGAAPPKASVVTVRSGGEAPVPVAVTAPPARPTAAVTAPPGADPKAGPPAERDDTSPRPGGRGDAVPDFGRITGAAVGAVAVPVAAVVRVARRKNVIGSETTGSIPVHLLFRDEPEGAVPRMPRDDDGGPDTVAMAAPTPSGTGHGPAIPGPSKVQVRTGPVADPASGGKSKAKPKPKSKEGTGAASKGRAASSARPVPTADPTLVERPGPVLPGWVGVAGGALALAGCAAVVWWTGAVPAEATRMLRLPERPYNGIHLGQWALLALGVVLTLFALGGLGRGRVGYAYVLTLFGDYRGTVRRTGLLWASPLLLRRRVDVRLRHWRSEPLSAVDAKGTALDVTVLVVWRVRDTVRAALGVDGHEDYLREQVEAAMARVLSQLPADAFHEDAPTLRDAEAVGEALTRMLSAECAPVGVDVFSAQPTRIEYAPEVAAAMRRRRIAAIDAKHRDSVLTSVVDAVDDVVHRLTSRGLVELDDYERKTLVKDLTVAFYTGRTGPVEGA